MFISYAQNYEDVMLMRALRHVEKGRYVDVGAQHPTTHSVTRAFYDRGWRGVNIDPMPQWHDQLMADRPGDMNLRLAAGAEDGQLRFFSISDTGLSTSDESLAKEHAARGFAAEETSVRMRRLDDILDECSDGEIHFLKVDVEGAEEQVLAGIGFRRHRPWIVLVEATVPLSQRQNHAAWEPGLLARGYVFVYADGLNRFYLAEEHAELKAAFAFPPNVFDEFMPAELAQCQAKYTKLHEDATTTLQHAQWLEKELGQSQLKYGKLHEDATSIHQHAQLLEKELLPLRANHADMSARLDSTQAKNASLEQSLEQASGKTGSLTDQLDRAVGHSRQQRQRIEFLLPELERLRAESAQLRNVIGLLQGSWSWALTAPLRMMLKLLRREMTPRQVVRRIGGKLLLRFGPQLLRHATVRRIGKAALRRMPGQEQKVRSAVGAAMYQTGAEVMTPRANEVFEAIRSERPDRMGIP